MVITLIVAFIVLLFVAILLWRTGDQLLAKFPSRQAHVGGDREDGEDGPLPLLIFHEGSQESSVTPLPMGAAQNALPIARRDDVSHEEWLPPRSGSANEVVQTGEHRRAAVPAELAGGKYEVIRELGRGGMAVVYLARERATGHEWAVKVIHGQFENDTDALRRFEREAELVARLQHPGIVPIHAVEWLEHGGLALVMDYIPGRTVKQLVHDEGPLPFERVQQWLDDIADALGYAHAQGIVHRDVKPENIFVNEKTGRAVLSDFGIARSLQSGPQLTLTSVALGTPTYMAPEQLDSPGIDARSDLYSLGVVGWEMLTGHRPWDGETVYQIIYRVKSEELLPIDAIRPDTPERLLVAIEGLLAKSISDRWQSATQFRTQLTTGPVVRRPRTPSAVPVSAETIAFRRPRVKRTRRWLAPMAVAASLLISVTWVFARPNSGRWLAQPVVAALAQQRESLARQSVPPLSPAVSATDVPVQSIGDTLSDTVRGVRPDTGMLSHFAGAPGVLAPAITDNAPTTNAPTTVSPPVALAPVTPNAAPVLEPRTLVAPARSVSGVANVAQRYTVAPGMTNTCLASPAGDIQCWGGNGTRVSVGRDGQLRFVKLSVGTSSMCAITVTREAYCWGSNESGQLGDGTVTARTTPSAVVGDYTWTSIATGSAHACGVLTDARVFCWGNGRSGQLGNGAESNASRPVALSGVKGIAFATVVTGWNHNCALTTDGVAYCWGDNSNGALGDGTRNNRSAPVPVRTTAHFIMLAAGNAHTCGITTSNAVLCWGQNKYGQLGIVSTENVNSSPQLLPMPIRSGETFVTIAAGAVHTCAIGRDNDVWCWGRNGYGQLGDGSTVDRFAPTRVSGGHRFVTVAAFGAHTCGTTVTDELFCWGYNLNGQIGDGTREHRLRPTYVEK